MILILHRGPFLDAIVILIPDLGQNSDTDPASWAMFGRDSDTNPGFGTK